MYEIIYTKKITVEKEFLENLAQEEDMTLEELLEEIEWGSYDIEELNYTVEYSECSIFEKN